MHNIFKSDLERQATYENIERIKQDLIDHPERPKRPDAGVGQVVQKPDWTLWQLLVWTYRDQKVDRFYDWDGLANGPADARAQDYEQHGLLGVRVDSSRVMTMPLHDDAVRVHEVLFGFSTDEHNKLISFAKNDSLPARKSLTRAFEVWPVLTNAGKPKMSYQGGDPWTCLIEIIPICSQEAIRAADEAAQASYDEFKSQLDIIWQVFSTEEWTCCNLISHAGYGAGL